MNWFLILLAVVALFGCAKIPEADEKWASQNVPLGGARVEVEGRLMQRGFRVSDYGYHPESSARAPFGSIGFVAARSAALSAPECYAKPYSRLIASGDRLICVSYSEAGEVLWRGVGWFGAGL